MAIKEDSWDGARFQTSIESKRIKVKCGLLKERGDNQVTMNGVSGRECFVEVRTPDRQVFRTTVSSVQDGLYVCFDNYTDTCIFQGAEP